MNIFKNYTRLWMLLIASIMSCVAIAQDENYGIGDGFDPANPGNPGRNGWNAATGEVIIDDFTTGNLNNTITNKIGSSGSAAVTQIVVAGVINNTDFRVGNNYAKCTLVDFSRTAGISTVPSSAYSGNTHLCSIMLPTSITDIGSNAFNGCSALTAMTCYTLTPPKVEPNALNGVADGMIVYVPSEAVDRYQEADIWKNFTILPIQETVHSLTVNMPSDIDLGIFKNMTLELVNAKSGQSYRYIITDKNAYVFNNLIENTVYKAYVKNNLNNIFGETNEVSINDKDAEVTFASLSIPQNVNLSVLADGNDVTSQATVTWTDSIGNYLSQGSSLTGYAIGKKLNYSIALPQNVVMEYALPNTTQYVVADGENNIVCTLTPLQKVVITGKVLDLTTKSGISGAVVSASQTFGGKYSKTTNAKTDAKGQYSIEIFRVPTSLAIAASDYISQTMDCDVINAEGENVSVADVSLKSISGAVISIDFTYKKCPDNAGEEGEVESFYSDYNNVDYAIFNKTQNRSIGQFNAQYPQIVLLEEVNENDVLEITASSRTSAFVPVKATATIDAEQRASATFNVVELGKMKSLFTANANASVVGSLYDANGKLLKTYDYSGGSLTVSNLADGYYTLVTMGSSRLFNTIYDLSQLPQTGLIKDVDYVQNSVSIKSGELSIISIAEVPTLDEGKLYYTGDNTSFTVNKSSIVAGNYLTLTGHLDFKSAYSSKVSNVNLIVDLPESCTFVENSVMVGNTTSSYTLEGNRIIIPIARYTDRVRFCIIPTLSGDFAPSAFAQFDIDGETITQPIGSANYTAKDLSITVPSTVSKTTIPVSGTAIGASDIEIYDGDALIGQTRSLTNGTWTTICELTESYNLSKHRIYAKIKTKNGLELLSETLLCQYDKNAIEVSIVTMINTAHTSANLKLHDYVTVFDFQNPSTSIPSYWYWPNYPDFTFLVDFTNNDPDRISNVVINVLTSDNKIVSLDAEYNKKKNCWVAVAPFKASSLPVNLDVSFNADKDFVFDDQILSDYNESIKNEIGKDDEMFRKLELLQDSLYAEYAKQPISQERIDSLLKAIKELSDVTEEEDKMINEYVSIIYTKWKKVHPEPTPDDDKQLPKYIAEEIDKLIPTPNKNKAVVEFIDAAAEGKQLVGNGTYTFPASKGNPEIKYESSNKVAITSIEQILMQIGLWTIDENHDSYGDVCLVNSVTGDKIFVKSPVAIPPSNSSNSDIKLFYGQMEKEKANYISEGLLTLSEIGSFAEEYGHGRLLKDILKDEVNKDFFLKGHQYDATNLKNAELKKFKAGKALGKTFSLIGVLSDGYYTYKDFSSYRTNAEKWDRIIETINQHCDPKEAERITSIAKDYKAQYTRRALSKTVATGAIGVAGVVSTASSGMTLGGSLLFAGGAYGAGKGLDHWEECYNEDNLDHIFEILNMVNMSTEHCIPIKINDPLIKYLFPNLSPVLDPSGYVYEGVSSNRLEGVTATAYYKETIEDMYGDKHENIVKWDATEYAQENPLFTDEYGMYAWDVPQGLWQVKFEKEGYETTYSEWLPVPPPQLDINIAMKQNVQPTVKSARAFVDAVEMEFDKYMMPELLTADNIRVMVGETAVEGTVELLNEEVSYEGNEEKYASKVRFNAAAPFDATEITLMVSNRVKSYAGIRMQDDFSQTFTIEPEVREIVCESDASVVYGNSSELTVQVLPAVSSAGKTVKVKSSSTMILSTDVEELTLDSEGKASLTVNGELPGTASITYSVEGYDLSATTMVSVEQEQLIPDSPVASVASGSALLKGSSVTLSCPTSGVTIYYTTDGSCPCDAGAIKYEGTPITVSKGMTLKAMAVGEKGDESNIATYIYTIRQTDLQIPLEKGWNWISHNRYADLTSEELQQDYVERVLTQTCEIYRDPKIGFTGNINDVSANDGIKVNMSAQSSLKLDGDMFNPYLEPVSLKAGWNWIGYPLSVGLTVDNALVGMNSEVGDFVVNINDGFSQYDGEKWIGTLNVMAPGKGYLMKSASDKEFIYNTLSVHSSKALMAKAGEQIELPWSVDVRKYPNVMCVTAELYANELKSDDGKYVVAAFVDGECRGIGKTIGDKVFLMVHGGDKADVDFFAFDTESGSVYDIEEKAEFTADIIGSVALPQIFHLGGISGINSVIYDKLTSKSIHNILGQKVKSIDRSGVYIIDGKKVVVTKKNENDYSK